MMWNFFEVFFWGALANWTFFFFVCLGDGKSAVKTGETTESTAPVPVKKSVAFQGMGFLFSLGMSCNILILGKKGGWGVDLSMES